MSQTLGDLVGLQRGNTYKSSLLGMPGPVLLGLGSIQRNGGFKDAKLQTYGGPSDPRMLLSPGDIYVSLKDVTQSADLLGAVARVPSHVAVGRLTQDTVKLVFKQDAHPAYIYWLLRTPEYRAYCRAHSTGTTNLGLSREDFFAFPVPTLTVERELLLELLQNLDDKIELNRRMNDTLEAMAQAIFRDWFVDFGPTRRKLQGATDPVTITGGLVQDAERARVLADLFPATLGGGELPEGWTFRPLVETLVLQRGFDLPKSTRSEGPYPVVAASGPSGGHSEFRVPGPGVCTGRSGVLGKVYYVQENFWPLNTSLWVKDYPNATPIYAYFMLREIDLLALNAGSAVPTLNRNHVHNRSTATPPFEVIRAFSDLAGRLMDRLHLCQQENHTLAATRDLLLPKLMSGEIRLRDADEMLEAAQ